MKKFLLIIVLALAIGGISAMQSNYVYAGEAFDIYLEDGRSMHWVNAGSLTGTRENFSVECYYGGPEGHSRVCDYFFEEDSDGVMWFKHNAGLKQTMVIKLASEDQDAMAILNALEAYGYL